MAKSNKINILFSTLLFTIICPLQIYAAGVILPGATVLGDSGSVTTPAQWYLDSDYTTSSTFTIGSGGKHYNYLTVDNNYSFTVTDNLTVGPSNSQYNLLDVRAGSKVSVYGDVYGGTGSIMYYSKYNRINVSGSGAVLSATGSIDFSSGYNAIDNILSLSNGGIAVADSDKDGEGGFQLYNHWSYGNSWLELDGGALFLFGDKTDDFTADKGILSSIKVWDEISGEFQKVSTCTISGCTTNSYFSQLAVDYILDSAHASSLGFSDEFVGFTVVHNTPVPVPAAVWLFCSGLLGLIGLSRRDRATR